MPCEHLQHGKCFECKRRENVETLKAINDRETKLIDDYTEARDDGLRPRLPVPRGARYD